MPGEAVLSVVSGFRKGELKSPEPVRMGRGKKLRGNPKHSGFDREALGDSQSPLDVVVVRERGSGTDLIPRPECQ